MGNLQLVVGWVVSGFLGLLGLAIVWKVWTGAINLNRVISEPNGDASMSRFQLLIFTFVIALSLYLITVSKTPPGFPDKIPPEILGLLGISAGSYLVSKGIQFSKPEGVERVVAVKPPAATVKTSSTQQFTVDPPNEPVSWSIVPAGVGGITATGLYTAPAAIPANPTVSIMATSTSDPSKSAVSTITIT